jgi:tubulin epsilon
MRFEGSLNVDINEISMNLVPYPRLNYLLSSLAPLYAPADVKYQAPTKITPSTSSSSSLKAKSSMTRNSPTSAPQRSIDAAFDAMVSPETQLMGKVDPRTGVVIACAVLVRGSGIAISDIRRNIER